MASADAKPIAKKNVAYRVTFPIFDADGDLVAGATGLDSEVSKDGGTFTDCTNEATEIATSSGMYYLDLTSTEMNADTVAIIVKTATSGAKTTPIVLYPEEAGDIRVDVTQISGDATAADNLELDYDGTGYAKANSTIGIATDVTNDVGITQAGADKAWSTAARALTDKAGFSLSSAGIQAIWDVLTSALTTAGSIGKLLVDNINAAITSRSSHAAADIWSVVTRALTDKAGFSISGTKTTLDALNDISQANVNTEVSDVLKTDTISELAAEPGTTPTFEKALMWLYMLFRNKRTMDSSEDAVHNNAGTKISESSVSDDGSTYTRDKYRAVT